MSPAFSCAAAVRSLDTEVRAVLWSAGAPLSPGQVRERLPARGGQQPEPAYSTVVTTLARLHAKGVLSRERAGHAHRYRPVADEAGLAARRMRQVLEAGTDRDLVLTRFVSGLPAGDEQLLRRLLGPRRPARRVPRRRARRGGVSRACAYGSTFRC